MRRYHSDRDNGEHFAHEASRYGHEAEGRAEAALEAARRNARRMNERLAHEFERAHAEAGPAIDRWTSQASDLAHRGGRALREGSWELRDRTLHASRTGMQMAREEPIKAALLALGVIAAACAVYGLISRSR